MGRLRRPSEAGKLESSPADGLFTPLHEERQPTMELDTSGPAFESRFRVRSYELDALGHVNHAVFFNYFEQARFEALEAGGFPAAELGRRGWSVVVVHAEADFRREATQGDELLVRTRVEDTRRTSMRLTQEVIREDDGERIALGAVVAVWLGREGRPMAVPEEVRRALGVPS